MKDDLAHMETQFYFVVVRHKVSLVAIVDLCDAVAVNQHVWKSHSRAGDGAWSARAMVNGRWVYLRQLIAERAYGPRPSPEHVCEHLNGNLRDCRRENVKWSHRNATTYRRQKQSLAALANSGT